MSRRVAVIAGTKIDTQMGVDYINSRHREDEPARDYPEPVYCPVSEDCDAQMRFQYSGYDYKRKRLDEIFWTEIETGTRDFFIYCNSLSGAFDFEKYAEELTELLSSEDGCVSGTGEEVFGKAACDRIRVYTPLQVYRELGEKYKRIGLMAANNLSAYGIEKALMTNNSDLYVIGTGNMSIVRAIEDGLKPQEVISECGLSAMITYMQTCGAEAILLGCTHFPYIKKELEQYAAVPLIDPADLMYAAMMAAGQQA